MKADLSKQSTPERESASFDSSEPQVGGRYARLGSKGHAYVRRSYDPRAFSEVTRADLPKVRMTNTESISGGRYPSWMDPENYFFYDKSRRNPRMPSEAMRKDLQEAMTTDTEPHWARWMDPEEYARYVGSRRDPRMLPETMHIIRDARDEDESQGEDMLKSSEQAGQSSHKFSQALLSTIAAHRALSQKREELENCQQGVRDAQSMVQEQQKLQDSATELNWQEQRAFFRALYECESGLRQRQELEKTTRRLVKHLQHRADKEAQRLRVGRNSCRWSRELEYLLENVAFWTLFDEFKETSTSIEHLGSELRSVERSRDHIDNAIDRNCRPGPASDADVSGSISFAWNPVDDREMASIPRLYGKLEELHQRKEEAISRQRDQWMQLAQLAEEALFKAGMLESSVKQTAGPEERG